jgi:adenylyltransferase/sulfurtransferase
MNPAGFLRYARHLTLPEVGADGQRRLGNARILLVGAGGLGSPAALYLTAAGVGTLGIVDGDKVDITNLQRQVLHGTSDIGRGKVDSAGDRLRDLNPDVTIEPHPFLLTSGNAVELFRAYDLIVDGSDNFPTRYLVNDAAVLAGKPYVYGSIFKFDGQVSVFAAKDGPCYRCLFAEPPAPELIPSCAEAGVLGVLPGIVGTLQALEAIKLILRIGTPLVGRLLMFDGLALTTRELRVHRVREPWEWEGAHIAGSRLIPLGSLADRVSELDARREIVTVCHRGARSLTALRLLAGAGFSKVKSLAGGIDAYAARVDPKLSRY